MPQPAARPYTTSKRPVTGLYSKSHQNQGQTPTSISQIAQGKITTTIYSLIREEKFKDVISLMSTVSSRSRGVLSLLGYCYYQVKEYDEASDCYQELTRLMPGVGEYWLYFAQSLYKTGLYTEAQEVIANCDFPALAGSFDKLEAAIRFQMKDYDNCKDVLDRCLLDADTISNQAHLLFQADNFIDACLLYQEALNSTGYRADLMYNIALCHYYLRDYDLAMNEIGEIIERSDKLYPYLNVGISRDNLKIKSVGNSEVLHQSYLIQSFNMKAAIDYNLKRFEGAREALVDMPPRLEHELDGISLHNQALINFDQDTAGCFEKLEFLIRQASTKCPKELFANLLLLYIKYNHYDLAADLMAENPSLLTNLSPYLYDFLDASRSKCVSAKESLLKFDDLADKHLNNLKFLSSEVQESQIKRDNEHLTLLMTEYDKSVEQYIPIMMAQGKIHWDEEQWDMVEQVFQNSIEFCSDLDVWKLSIAHVLFVQGGRYADAITFYEPIVRKETDNVIFFNQLLEIPAIILANLCVSYIMDSRNAEAETLMKRIEEVEDQVLKDEPTKRLYHLCTVNLVIGTLYCSKSNFEFGISRIVSSFEPFHIKLGPDTWDYAKRCLLALLESLSRHYLIIADSLLEDVCKFLDRCDKFGINLVSYRDSNALPTTMTISSEARFLKSIFLRLYD